MANFLFMVQISIKIMSSEPDQYLTWKSGEMAVVFTGTHF
jgi:hypothetical protein